MKYQIMIVAVFLTLAPLDGAWPQEVPLDDRLARMEQRLMNIEQMLNELKESSISTNITDTPLPGSFGQQELGDLFSEFKRNWNAQDVDGLYNLISAWAQLQVDKSDVGNLVGSLYPVYGEIENGAYSYFSFKQKINTGAYWDIFYDVRQKNGKVTTLRFTIREQDGNTEVVGFTYGI